MPHAKAPSPSQVDAYFKELNNWGRWGHDDQLGTVNLITPAKQAAAERLVRTGRTVSLARPIGPQPARSYYISYPLQRDRSDAVTDRFSLVYHGYAVTHIDALCHVAFDKELYNGRPFQQNFTDAGARWCPIDPLFGGISTRGVLLDVAASRQEGYVTVGNPVTPQELDAVAARAGVRVEPGDVVVLRSGQAAFVHAHPDWVPRVAPHPGLHISCLTWFREHDIAAIAWDMMDERPSGYEGYGFGTHLAIPFLGLTLIDNTDPERLAVVCAAEQRYEFLFTAAPLPLVGSTGAPTHPLAIF
jgi:kynurenine formamidase